MCISAITATSATTPLSRPMAASAGMFLSRTTPILAASAACIRAVESASWRWSGACRALHRTFRRTCSLPGAPARVYGINVVGLRKAGVVKKVREELKEAFRLMYRSNLNMSQAIEAIEDNHSHQRGTGTSADVHSQHAQRLQRQGKYAASRPCGQAAPRRAGTRLRGRRIVSRSRDTVRELRASAFRHSVKRA